MLEQILTGSVSGSLPGLAEMLICTGAAIVYGFICALGYMYQNTYTRSFTVTLVLLPAVVQMVIMLVNGNLGTGVAIVGAFSLVRFRSVPGSAREIGSIFTAMAAGLAAGMGYLGYGIVFVCVITMITIILLRLGFGTRQGAEKLLKITIPENYNYANMFDDLFAEYALHSKQDSVRTISMGSLFELQYSIIMRNPAAEKEFIDAIRCRNGNLPVSLGQFPQQSGGTL